MVTNDWNTVAENQSSISDEENIGLTTPQTEIDDNSQIFITRTVRYAVALFSDGNFCKFKKLLTLAAILTLSVFTTDEVLEDLVRKQENAGGSSSDKRQKPQPNPPFMIRLDTITACAMKLTNELNEDNGISADPFSDINSSQVKSVEWFITAQGIGIPTPGPLEECSWDIKYVNNKIMNDFRSIYALLNLKFALGLEIESWNNPYDAVASLKDICNFWHRVTCNSEGTEITKLHLSNLVDENGTHMLTGTIPFEILGLRSLQRLELYRNPKLVGVIPPSIGNYLYKLQYIFLHDTSISGTIPSTFGKMDQLTELYIENTNLEGSVPESLCKLRDLQGGQLKLLHADCGDPPLGISCPYPNCCNYCEKRSFSQIF